MMAKRRALPGLLFKVRGGTNAGDGVETIREATGDSILAMIGDELKKYIAATFDPVWKAAVLELADREDREYKVFTAFRNELTAAFAGLRAFPERYARHQIRPPIGEQESDQEKTRRYLAEQAEERRRALEERAAPGAEDVIAAAVASLPWRREREALQRSA